MMLADFEPGIFFLILWGIISWLTRKKKNQIPKNAGEVVTKPKEDLFGRLQKLKDHLSKEVDFFPSTSHPLEAKEKYFTDDNKYDFEEPEIPTPLLEDVHENEECVFDTDIKISTAEHDNWLKHNLSRKSELRKLMVLKEVLGEPRSLKPYTGDYFQ
jgi:hypothetical protein